MGRAQANFPLVAVPSKRTQLTLIRWYKHDVKRPMLRQRVSGKCVLCCSATTAFWHKHMVAACHDGETIGAIWTRARGANIKTLTDWGRSDDASDDLLW